MARKFFRRAGKKARKPGTKRMRKVARAAAKDVINLYAEKNYHDTTLSENVGSAGSITNLSDMGQGDTAILREGDKVRLKNLELRLAVTADDATNIFRCVVFRDISSNGSAPTVSNLLGGVQQSMNNVNVSARFKILYDRTFYLSTSGSNVIKGIVKYIPINATQTFSGSSTAPYHNAVYLLMISDSTVGGPAVEGEARVRYLDM